MTRYDVMARQNAMYKLAFNLDKPLITMRDLLVKFQARMADDPSSREWLNDKERVIASVMASFASRPRAMRLVTSAGDRIDITMDTDISKHGEMCHPGGSISIEIDCGDTLHELFPCNGCGECCLEGGTRAFETPVAPGDWPGRLHDNKERGKHDCINLFFDTTSGKYRCASNGVKTGTCKNYTCEYMMGGRDRGREKFSKAPVYHLCETCTSRTCPSCRYLIKRAEWFIAFARVNKIKPLDIEDGIVVNDMLAAGLRDHPELFDEGRVKAAMDAIRDITGMTR